MDRVAEFLEKLPDLERVYAARMTEPAPHAKVGRLEDVIGAVNSWGGLIEPALPDVEIGRRFS